MILLCLLAFLSLAYFSLTLYKYPHLRRMSLRRMMQQKSSTFWILCGSSISIAMIASSLLLQHSVSTSVDRMIAQRLGPIVADMPAERQTLLADGYFDENDLETIRTGSMEIEPVNWLPIVGTEASLVKGEGAELHSVYVFGFSLEEAEAFDKRSFQLLPKEINENEIILSELTAQQLNVAAGETIFYYDRESKEKLKVAAVVPEAGLTGYRGFKHAQASAIVHVDTARTWTQTPENAYTNLLVSTTKQKSLDQISVYPPSEWDMVFVASALNSALSNSTKLLPIFTIASLTALATAVALIFNIFKMVAIERRQEFGILRAIGMKRADIKVLLRLEGFFYACLSGLVGTVLGTGLAYFLLRRLKQVLSPIMELQEGITVNYTFVLDPLILIGSFSLGLILIGTVVFFLSSHTASIPIIEALKPLSEDHGARKRSKTIVRLGVFSLCLVIWLLILTRLSDFQTFVNDHNQLLPLIVFGCSFGLVVLASMTVVCLLDPIVQSLLFLFKRFPTFYSIFRLAFRYPLIQRLRTGLLVMMFALVTFLTSFSATFNETFTAFLGDFDSRAATGGYDLIATKLNERISDDVDTLFEKERGFINHIVTTESFPLPDFYDMSVHGIDEIFIDKTELTLINYDQSYANETGVWEALLQHEDYVIVSEALLKYSSGGNYKVGDHYEFTISWPMDLGAPPITATKTIIGIAALPDERNSYSSSRGLWASLGSLRKMAGNTVPIEKTLLVKVNDKVDVSEAKEALNKTLLAHHLPTLTDPHEAFLAGTAFIRLFFNVFEGFNAIAIVIGLTGLLMVMLRVVRERRQSIGVLRAVGLTARSIYTSIWVEGLFLGLTGTLIGIFAGAYSGVLMFEMLASSDGELLELVSIQLPYVKLLIYLLGSCGLSVLVSSVAARQAMNLSPVEATRYIG